MVPKLKEFVKSRHNDIIRLVRASRDTYTRRGLMANVTVDAVVDALCLDGIKLETLPYDGALILYSGDNSDESCDDNDSDDTDDELEGDDQKQHEGKKLIDSNIPNDRVVRRPYPNGEKVLRKRGVNMDDILVVYDFKSQYPFSMITINLGKDTHLSTDQVYTCLEHIVKTRGCSRKTAAEILCNEHVNCSHTRRIDDLHTLVDYVDDKDYVRRNFVFFAKKPKAVQNQQFILEIESRVVDKRKSQDDSLPSNVRKAHKNRSETKKVMINSRYGLIQSTVDPRFQPTVTGRGRKSIREVTACLRRNMDKREFYGDTDSCFVYKRNLSPFDMMNMSLEEMYRTLMVNDLTGMSLDAFKNVYDKHYPVEDTSSPRKIREAAGSVMHVLCVMMEKGLSSKYLEVEAEKALNPTILPTTKKYIAHNCVTGKPLTKGLSLNNKAAAEMTKDILLFLYNASVDSFNCYQFASKLYHKLGSDFLAQICPTASQDVIRRI
ncbi:hypothetical protein ElyMa_004524200 [Elysia marginata]|uniref:DNA-directed DNA polymerase n=1 Tax=Elysia marginata TaxID=1093978 RepID=A0AAV4HP91_9GAST|nr:hypothetical protein ElyMa_004524200 [Elysia marginata]